MFSVYKKGAVKRAGCDIAVISQPDAILIIAILNNYNINSRLKLTNLSDIIRYYI